MKVFVTGVDGYIGVMMVPLLQSRGHEVVALDTGYYRDGCLYNGINDFPNVHRRDLRHIKEGDLDGVDAVVHLAELSNDPLGQHNPEITRGINHRASVNLAQIAKKSGARRFIYASSCSVYGAGNNEVKTEDSATNPQTTYAECKVMVERDVSDMADDDFSPTFMRNATAFGPSPRMRFDIVLNNLAGLAWTDKAIRMNGDGSAYRPLVHISDICDAVACALEAPRDKVHNQIFNVGQDSDNYRVKEIAQIVADVFPGCAIEFGPAGADNRSYKVNFDKLKNVLGFTCKRNATIGAVQLYALFKKIDMTKEVFNFRAFTRLKQLEYLLRLGQLDDQLFWRTQ
jgi:nucleoside-diphosphate-sugar epimerase